MKNIIPVTALATKPHIPHGSRRETFERGVAHPAKQPHVADEDDARTEGTDP
jgi:hypothetical protein